MSRGPQVVTFGCRLNAFESEIMRGHASAGPSTAWMSNGAGRTRWERFSSHSRTIAGRTVSEADETFKIIRFWKDSW